MRTPVLCRLAALAAAILTLSTPALAQAPPLANATGLIVDYTPSLDTSGPWHVAGNWSLSVNVASGKVDFVASLAMMRSENATRSPHTHHVHVRDAVVATLANGYRISGTATFTSNGSLAGFSGTPIDIEVTGGSAVALSNLTITFGGGAATHFGPQIRGVFSTYSGGTGRWKRDAQGRCYQDPSDSGPDQCAP